MSRRAREAASASGDLPHELLLRICRGESVDGHKPSFHERIDAAKAAAPYYAPKLAASSVTASITPVTNASELSDDELAAIIAGCGG